MMEIFTTIKTIAMNHDNITIVLAVVGLFSAIATVTPTKKDDKLANFILKTIHFLGANFGKAKNKDE